MEPVLLVNHFLYKWIGSIIKLVGIMKWVPDVCILGAYSYWEKERV